MRCVVISAIGTALALAACASGGMRAPSLVQLLVDPHEFAGSNVRVQGYLSDAGNLSLFLTKEHADTWDHVSSVPVADATPDGYIIQNCVGHHAVVDGTLEKRSDAPLFVGKSGVALMYTITSVQRILVFRDGRLEQCWPKPSGE
jgi:hypothetical protein